MSQTTEEPAARHRSRLRALLGGVLVAAIVLAAARAAYVQRDQLAVAWDRLSPLTLAGSLVLAVLGMLCTYGQWRSTLADVDVHLPLAGGARTFFLSQLGKYLPGSVWPILLQMEAGRRAGATRRTMLTANLLTLAVGCATALLLAASLLPLSDPQALRQYWWVLLAVPPLLVATSPKVLPRALDLVFGLLGRAPFEHELTWAATGRSALWASLTYLLLGAHLTVLAAAMQGSSLELYLLSTGGLALAFALGVLAVPLPAGVGVRDAVIVLALSAVMPTGAALLAAVTSRALLIVADLALAAALAPLGHRPRRG